MTEFNLFDDSSLEFADSMLGADVRLIKTRIQPLSCVLKEQFGMESPILCAESHGRTWPTSC